MHVKRVSLGQRKHRLNFESVFVTIKQHIAGSLVLCYAANTKSLKYNIKKHFDLYVQVPMVRPMPMTDLAGIVGYIASFIRRWAIAAMDVIYGNYTQVHAL